MRSLLILFSLIGVMSLEGCAYSVHQYALGDYYPTTPGAAAKSARAIQSDDDQFVILGFQFNTDYIDRAREKLISQCTGGEIIGVNIRHSTSLGFLSYTNKAIIKATCLE